MPPSPRVSVVLPVRDAVGTVSESIESILSQSESDLELIIVDDGSGDETRDILRHYAAKDKRVRILSSDGSGIVAALNLGVEASQGDCVARMDADDVSHKERLCLQCDFLDSNPDVGLVSSCVEHWCKDGESRKGYAAYVDWTNGVLNHEAIKLSRFVESPFAHPSVAFRKVLVKQLGGYRDGPFPEDYELWLRWLECGVRMEKISRTLLRWRDHDDRLSRCDPRYSAEAFYRMKLEYLYRWLERNNPFHPEVKIWGAGRTTRARAGFLASAGAVVTGYYDVDPRKIGRPRSDLLVRSVDEIPGSGKEFIVGMVGARGAREKVAAFLRGRGHREGIDYILAA
ncbi:MAG: glycosyltransferase [Opitutales bacterium]